MSELAELTERILEFRDRRDWKVFHNPKDLALALSVEAAELLELFRFKSAEEVAPGPLRHELADVLYFVLLLAHEAGIDLREAVLEKLRLNEERYPVELSRGRNLKYTELPS
ncbi:MAG: nucleotide pyrophosphohydrolase [Candidatus Eremiobacterota bacterium]